MAKFSHPKIPTPPDVPHCYFRHHRSPFRAPVDSNPVREPKPFTAPIITGPRHLSIGKLINTRALVREPVQTEVREGVEGANKNASWNESCY